MQEPVSNAGTQQEEGRFLLNVTPPTQESVRMFFQRNYIFVIDRSGSMNGEPWTSAIEVS